MRAVSKNRLLRIGAVLVQARGRSDDRYRRVAFTAGASAFARLVALATGLVSVPLAVSYLGAERYGLWATMSSLTGMLVFSDLGIGNGLMNLISEANGRDDTRRARIYVTNALILLLVVAAFLALVFVLVRPHISWAGVFNAPSPAVLWDIDAAITVLMGCFIVSLPLGVVTRIQMGYQEGFLTGIWQAFGSILGLLGVLLVIQFRGGLAWLVLALLGAPLVASAANGWVLFSRRRPFLRPKLQDADPAVAISILRLGMLFFILQLAVALAYTSDNLVAAQALGPTAVARYATAMKLFILAPTVANMVLLPLWPAYAEALARGDVAWIRKTLRRSVLLAVALTVVPSGILVVLGQEIVQLWVGPGLEPEPLLLAGMGTWAVISTVGNAVAMLLNGATVVRFQVVTALLVATFSLGGKIWLVHLWGLPGIIWATVFAYVLFAVVPYLMYMPHFFRIHASQMASR